jgi:Family of unknown function (DUF6496)
MTKKIKPIKASAGMSFGLIPTLLEDSSKEDRQKVAGALIPTYAIGKQLGFFSDGGSNKKSGSHPGKIKTVMNEFKSGELKSSSGKKVTNPKQAVAIALSEAGLSKNKKSTGGDMGKRGGGAIMASKKSTMGEALSKGGMKYAEGGDMDIAQDKALIKKAIKMHDAQEHKGEHTDLSHLKKGGEESKAHEAEESKKEEMKEHGKRGGGAIMAEKSDAMGVALSEGGLADTRGTGVAIRGFRPAKLS